MLPDVDYVVSMFMSEFAAYQSKSGIKACNPRGKITMYITRIWKETQNDVEKFTRYLIYYTFLETACIQRAFSRIRMKNRCKHCKLWNPCMDAIVPLVSEDWSM
jgi:hypothetical protein